MSNLLDLYHIQRDVPAGREELRQILVVVAGPFITDWIIGTIARYEDDLGEFREHSDVSDDTWASEVSELEEENKELKGRVAYLENKFKASLLDQV